MTQKVDQGMTVKDDVTGQTARGRSATGETAQAAAIALAESNIKMRTLMARQFPRVWQQVEQRLSSECARPAFAEVARYRKPVGEGIEGPSIRFAETAMRLAGNMEQSSAPQYEDEEKRTLGITVTDYECNNTFGATVTVPKSVERLQLNGRTPLGRRTNSKGKIVFLVQATEDEMLNTQNAMVSKAVRTLILRHIPPQIIDQCMEQCRKVKLEKKKSDPLADQNALLAAFLSIGVNAGQVVEYLGHSLDHGLTDKESLDLWGLASAIRDGESTWGQALEEVLRHRQPVTPGEAPPVAAETPAQMEERFTRRIDGAKSLESFKRVMASIAMAEGMPPEAVARLREKSKVKKGELGEKRQAEKPPPAAATPHSVANHPADPKAPQTPPVSPPVVAPSPPPVPTQATSGPPTPVVNQEDDDALREQREFDAYVAKYGKEPGADNE